MNDRNRNNLRERLKEKAEALFQVPQHFELLIDDYAEQIGQNKEQAVFAWVKPGTEEGISVTLSANGELLRYTSGLKTPSGTTEVLSEEKLKNLAEHFLTDHYPEALIRFPQFHASPISDGVRFSYRQDAFGMPLPYSGCLVTVHFSGKVIDFIYYGDQHQPDWPDDGLIPREQIRHHLEAAVGMKLQIRLLHDSVYTQGNNRLTLVYEPRPFILSVSALTEENLNREEESETCLSLPAIVEQEKQSDTLTLLEPTIEQWIGIDPGHYEVIREVDRGDVTGIVWRERNHSAHTDEDRSFKTFFRNRNEDTVKAKVDKATGRLLSFIWLAERPQGDLNLNRDECLQRAVQYLTRLMPDIITFLQLHADREEANEDDRPTQHFLFPLRKAGLPVEQESIHLTVNRTTGMIDSLLVTTVQAAELDQLDITPLIDPAAAKRLYLDAVDLPLQWEHHYSSENDDASRRYTLTYRIVDKTSGQAIRLVDAKNGGLYCSKN